MSPALTVDSLIKQIQAPPALEGDMQQVHQNINLAGGMIPNQGAYPTFGLPETFTDSDPVYALDFLDTLLSGQGKGWT